MDEDEKARLIEVLGDLSNSLLNGVKINIADAYGGVPRLDVDLTDLNLNVSGAIGIINNQTSLQEYNQALNSILEVRKLPNYSKKLLSDKLEVEETIDNLVKLIQKETEKELKSKKEIGS